MSKILYEPQTYFDLLDRSKWQTTEDRHQPWFNEPDEVAFLARGYRAALKRSLMGNLCGYIAVDVEHPWFGRKDLDSQINVHGGVTYTGFIDFESIFLSRASKYVVVVGF